MKIGIISLGLIGGSILKSLCKFEYEIYAVTRNADTLSAASEYATVVSDDISTVKDCDIVFVCSPMSKTQEILDKLEQVVSKNTIVADVCSLKEFVMKKERPYVFIGSHPMAGTENSGFNASFDTLFVGAKWVLTPSKFTDEAHIQKLSCLIEKTGASVVFADAKEHDKAVAMISHMPMIVAQALVKTVQNNALAVKLASSGFRDTTRLALSNLDMAQDMVSLNSKNITDSLISFAENAKNLLGDNYYSDISEIKDFRHAMYDKNGKNISN